MPLVLGLIPAKGASVRLPGKNIRALGDRPLIAWAADAARESGVIDDIVLSTENSEVKRVARAWGIETLDRPPELGRDPAGVIHVALDAISQLRQQGREYDRLAIILPTCPFRTAVDIHAAYRQFDQMKARFLLSVVAYAHTPFAALRLADGIATPYFPEWFDRKSQELPLAYRPNGAVHILDVPAFEAARSYVVQPLYAYVMPWERSIDIDTEADWKLAEAILAQRAQQRVAL